MKPCVTLAIELSQSLKSLSILVHRYRSVPLSLASLERPSVEHIIVFPNTC